MLRCPVSEETALYVDFPLITVIIDNFIQHRFQRFIEAFNHAYKKKILVISY